jgi:hypothetical protein
VDDTAGMDDFHTTPLEQNPSAPVMAASKLSTETEKRISLLFPPDQQQLVRTLLFEECGNNLPFLENLHEKRLERFQFAALKLSEGELDKLDRAIALAKADWRDLLMAAGFGNNVDAHRSWLPEQTWR